MDLFSKLCNSVFQVCIPCNESFLQEIQWNKEWFSNINDRQKGFWAISSNQQSFLKQFAKKYGITSPQQWGNISYRQVAFEGGSGLRSYLSKFKIQSLQDILIHVFPGTCSFLHSTHSLRDYMA